MTRLSVTALILTIGALGTATAPGGIAHAEDTDSSGRVTVKMPGTQQAVEVRGWDPKAKNPAASPPADDDAAATDAREPPPAMATPDNRSKVLRPPVVDDRNYRELEDQQNKPRAIHVEQESGEAQFGDGIHGRRPPAAKED